MNKLVDLTFDDQQKNEIIIENFTKMLYNRHCFGDSNLNNLIKSGINNFANYETFIKYNNETFYLKIISYKLNTIKKSEDIEKFLDTHIDDKKIFVILSGSTKIEKQLLEYNNTEVFNDVDLMVNIVENNLVPKHILLSDEEAKNFLIEYKINKENLPRILSGDRIAKYYNIKPGQIVKIIRPSITAGEEILYRVCVNGKIPK
jgi:DNA-directed RNA polymerase subunit H (RpoH/RPB5)